MKRFPIAIHRRTGPGQTRHEAVEWSFQRRAEDNAVRLMSAYAEVCVMAGKEPKNLVKTNPAGFPWLSWDLEKWFGQAYGRPYSLAWLPTLEFAALEEESGSSEGSVEEKAKAAA